MTMDTEATNTPNDSMQYLNHLQNLFAEYEHLQLEYSRLRQRVEENALAGHKNIDNEFANNCSEKGQLAALKIKNDYLEAESVKKNKLYCDLLESFKIDKAKHSELIANLERENKELKENLEFTLAENEILSESSKEMAEANFKEKREWLKEKEEYEKVVVWSKNINEKMKLYKEQLDANQQVPSVDIGSITSLVQLIGDKFSQGTIDAKLLQTLQSSDELSTRIEALHKILASQSIQITSTSGSNHKTSDNATHQANEDDQNNSSELLNLKSINEQLRSELQSKNETIEKLNQKYTRNRQVWETNEKNSTEEIQKLDGLIEMILQSLGGLPDEVKQNPVLQNVFSLINANNNSVK